MDSGYLISLIQTVLQYSGIRQKQKDIYRILCSDERYPSALSIIKTLAYWGVSASAYQADLGNIKKETGLKIVHLNVNGGRFFIVKEIGEHEIILVDTVKRTLPLDAFVEMWDGIVIIVETNGDVHLIDKRFSIRTALILCLLAFLICISQDKVGILIDLFGVFISYILLYHSIYIFGNIPLCIIGRKFDCNTVANSTPFTKHIHINLPLLSIWYFLTSIMLNVWGIPQIISTILCLCALPVVIYLLVYQLVFIKKKCLYCMLLSVCVMAKAIFALKDAEFIGINGEQVPSVGFVVIISLIITSLLYDKLKADEKEIKAATQLLRQKRKCSTSLLAHDEDIRLSEKFCMSLGNNEAPINIDTVVSSECHHCMKLVSNMFRIMRKYDSHVRWNIYWTKLNDDTKNKSNQNSIALMYIQDYLDNKCDIKKYPYNEKHVNNQTISESAMVFLDRSTSYLHELNISSFPQVYVNHKYIPNDYSVSDMEIIFNDWIMEEAISL